MLAPIILFVYKRLHFTKDVIQCLQKCALSKESKLFIFSDDAKNDTDRSEVLKVREYIHTVSGFAQVSIIDRERNFGLAENIIQGVTEVVRKYRKVIVLEDDLVCAPYFLEYMNRALDHYEGEDRIFSISGYNPAMKFPSYFKEKVYFNYRNSSWGWATWADRWAKVDWEVKDFNQFENNKALQRGFNRGGEDLSDMLINQMNGKVDSWSIRFSYTQFKNNAYTVYPVQSLVANIGTDGSGTHCGSTDRYDVVLDQNFGNISFSSLQEVDENIMKAFRKFYRYSLKRKLKKMLLAVTK